MPILLILSINLHEKFYLVPSDEEVAQLLWFM